MSKGMGEEPAVGVPYAAYQQGAPPAPATYQQAAPPQQFYYVGQNPHQAGMVPPNAVYGDPKGIPLQQTMYRDTPAPFNCVFCGSSGLTVVRLPKDFFLMEADPANSSVSGSKPSLAAVVGCMMPFMLGVCFLCPSMDCLWHKYHYCPHCGQKVADFEKSDPCLVVDAARWNEQSYALPA